MKSVYIIEENRVKSYYTAREKLNVTHKGVKLSIPVLFAKELADNNLLISSKKEVNTFYKCKVSKPYAGFNKYTFFIE